MVAFVVVKRDRTTSANGTMFVSQLREMKGENSNSTNSPRVGGKRHNTHTTIELEATTLSYQRQSTHTHTHPSIRFISTHSRTLPNVATYIRTHHTTRTIETNFVHSSLVFFLFFSLLLTSLLHICSLYSRLRLR